MELVDPYSNIDVIPLTDYLDIIDLSVVEEEINGMLSTYPFALVRITNLHNETLIKPNSFLCMNLRCRISPRQLSIIRLFYSRAWLR